MAEMLFITKNGNLKTQIMYKANLSFAQLNEYLSFLLRMDLMKEEPENGKTLYKTTTNGFKYLERYKELSNLLSEDQYRPSRNHPLLVFPMRARVSA